MPDAPYYATYCRFTTKDKKTGALLMGADNLVGDFFQIKMITEEGKTIAWMQNRFDQIIGFFDDDITYELQLCEARGWSTNCILASSWFTEKPEPGFYWGEAVIISYANNEKEAFDNFSHTIAKMLADGVRPAVQLSNSSIQAIVDSNGDWKPTGRVPKLKNEHGSALLKDHVTFNEQMVEKARNRNMGCMIGGWAGLLLIVAVLVLALKSCGLF